MNKYISLLILLTFTTSCNANFQHKSYDEFINRMNNGNYEEISIGTGWYNIKYESNYYDGLKNSILSIDTIVYYDKEWDYKNGSPCKLFLKSNKVENVRNKYTIIENVDLRFDGENIYSKIERNNNEITYGSSKIKKVDYSMIWDLKYLDYKNFDYMQEMNNEIKLSMESYRKAKKDDTLFDIVEYNDYVNGGNYRFISYDNNYLSFLGKSYKLSYDELGKEEYNICEHNDIYKFDENLNFVSYTYSDIYNNTKDSKIIQKFSSIKRIKEIEIEVPKIYENEIISLEKIYSIINDKLIILI